MTDIATIPTGELVTDLRDSLLDIEICKRALAAGVTHYTGGAVQYRLDRNRQIVEVIEAELARRDLEEPAL